MKKEHLSQEQRIYAECVLACVYLSLLTYHFREMCMTFNGSNVVILRHKAIAD